MSDDLRKRLSSEDERCAEARKLDRIDRAFRTGDLEALRAAVDDPTAIPSGPMPDTVGSCLVYAIYHSPLAFIRTLLEIGADPNSPVDDGFPPLIAALSTSREAPGAKRRTDVDDVIRLLLSFGVDPNQRGINDYTPLHMAVAQNQPRAVQILLDGGADPALRTRIDECETPPEMAAAANQPGILSIFDQHAKPVRRRLRSGLTLLTEVPGEGPPVRRQQNYLIRLRLWLNQGDPVRWQHPSGPVGVARLEDDGQTLITGVRLNRGALVNGLFYGIEGMRVGGMRRLEIAPQLGYGDQGVPGIIPPRAMLTAEVTILEEQAR